MIDCFYTAGETLYSLHTVMHHHIPAAWHGYLAAMPVALRIQSVRQTNWWISGPTSRPSKSEISLQILAHSSHLLLLICYHSGIYRSCSRGGIRVKTVSISPSRSVLL